MKSILLILLNLLLVSGSCCPGHYTETPKKVECSICHQTPCDNSKLAHGDSNKVSIKKIILNYLKKSSDKSYNVQGCEKCKNCRHAYPKKNPVLKVLTDILSKATCSHGNEEQNIINMIRKLTDPTECNRKPCHPYCDPTVQKVLKAILKAAFNCKCSSCPCECEINPTKINRDEYQYWFRTTKASIRKEMTNRGTKKNRSEPEEEKKTMTLMTAEKPDQVYSPKSKCMKFRNLCKACQRPDTLICPRYITDDCPALTKGDRYSICADCSQCFLKSNTEDAVLLSCTQSKPMRSPFIEFTKTGHPYKFTQESAYNLLIRTEHLQINDFRNQIESKTKTQTVYNPFCRRNRSVKRKRKGKKGKKL